MSTQQAFRSFFDLANQGFAITSPDTRWLHVNAALCRMLGYSEAELRQRTWVELTHPEDRAPDLKQFRRLLAGDINGYELNKRFLRKDGSLLHARLTVSAQRDAAGELLQVNATLLDRSEEQRALNALQLSEERFRLLAGSTLDGIWDWDLVAGTLWLSPSWKAQLGYRDKELPNAFVTWEELMHPDDRPGVMLHLRAYLADPADVWQETFRLRHRDEGWRQIMARAISVIDEGKVVRLLGVHVDVTRERESVEQLKAWSSELEAILKARSRELAEREALYRNIADYTFDWEIWTDTDGELRYCSPSCERISGYAADAFLQDPALCDRVVHPDDRARMGEHQARLAAEMPGALDALKVSYRVLRADGGLRWVEQVDHPMRTDQGEYAGIRSSIRDITEIHDAQLELEQQRDFVEAVLGTARAIILVLSPRAEVVRVNTSIEAVSGWRPDELVGRNWIDTCVPPEQRRMVHGMFKRAYQTQRTNGEVTELITKTGDIRQVRWYDELLDAAPGEERLLVAVGIDVTEQLAAEEALRRLNQDLEAKVKERTRELEVATAAMIQSEKLSSLGTLVAGMAHEINNPLMGLGNYVDYAREHSEGRVRDVLGKADRQIARIAGILENLLAYARPAKGAQAKPVDLVAAARQAVDLVAAELRHREIDLRDRLPDDLPAVQGEPGALQQVLLNLLINARDVLDAARKSAGSADTATLTKRPWVALDAGVGGAADGAPNLVWLEVSDNGPGVPSAIRHRVFDPFFTTKPRGSGTGLGLSVSDGIVRGCGGRLSLRVPDDGGAVFRIELPVAFDEEA